MYEQLLSTCNPSLWVGRGQCRAAVADPTRSSMFNSQLPPTKFLCAGDGQACCCSTVAFALMEACVSCQW